MVEIAPISKLLLIHEKNIREGHSKTNRNIWLLEIFCYKYFYEVYCEKSADVWNGCIDT